MDTQQTVRFWKDEAFRESHGDEQRNAPDHPSDTLRIEGEAARGGWSYPFPEFSFVLDACPPVHTVDAFYCQFSFWNLECTPW